MRCGTALFVCIAYNSDIFRRGAAEARLIGPVKCRIVVESAAGADITGRFMVADHRSSRQQPFDGHIPPNRRSGGAGEDPIDLRAAEKENLTQGFQRDVLIQMIVYVGGQSCSQ